jgi:hypothetical protein
MKLDVRAITAQSSKPVRSREESLSCSLLVIDLSLYLSTSTKNTDDRRLVIDLPPVVEISLEVRKPQKLSAALAVMYDVSFAQL